MRKVDPNSAILVTGGAGFVGSCFVKQQVDLGRRVVVLDALTYAGHRENLEGTQGPGSYELIVENISNQEVVYDILKTYEVSEIVSFAAESHVDRSILAPSNFIDTN